MTTTEPANGLALVVGATGGLGEAIARALARDGNDLALTTRSRVDAAEALAEPLRRGGRRVTVHTLDLDAEGELATRIDEIIRSQGPLRTVVHAVGADIDMVYAGDVVEAQWDGARRELDGFFRLVRAVLPHLRSSQGNLVTLTSAGIRRHPPGDILSTAPKAGIEALVRALAREEGRYGVRANAVAPGVIDAGIFRRLQKRGGFPDGWAEAAQKNIPLRRFGSAEDVAEVVAFLASPRAAYVTGQVISVDGGYSV